MIVSNSGMKGLLNTCQSADVAGELLLAAVVVEEQLLLLLDVVIVGVVVLVLVLGVGQIVNSEF